MEGGLDLTYILTDDNGTNPPDTNKTGVFQLPMDAAAGPYMVTVVDGSGCGYPDAVLNIMNNCEADLDCPTNLTNCGSSPDGNYCPDAMIDLCFNGDYLPQNGQVCWYKDSNASFDPYAGEGELVGCVKIPTEPILPTQTFPKVNEIHYNPSGPNDDDTNCSSEYVLSLIHI